MNKINKLLLSILISVSVCTLTYYEFFTPHSPTGAPLFIKSIDQFILYSAISSLMIFGMMTGFIPMRHTKKEAQSLKKADDKNSKGTHIKKYIWPAILAIIFTVLVKMGFITPREKFTAKLILMENTFSLISCLIISYIGFYILFNGPVYLRKKKENRIEGFRRKDKK